MKKIKLFIIVLFCAAFSPFTMAKGIPLIFNTGDELFQIEDAPKFDDGYEVGYACQHLGIMYADIWTWDCKLMAIDIQKFSAGELDSKFLQQMNEKYSESDRVRNPWNHYGALLMSLVIAGYLLMGRKKESDEQQEENVAAE